MTGNAIRHTIIFSIAGQCFEEVRTWCHWFRHDTLKNIKHLWFVFVHLNILSLHMSETWTLQKDGLSNLRVNGKGTIIDILCVSGMQIENSSRNRLVYKLIKSSSGASFDTSTASTMYELRRLVKASVSERCFKKAVFLVVLCLTSSAEASSTNKLEGEVLLPTVTCSKLFYGTLVKNRIR